MKNVINYDANKCEKLIDKFFVNHDPKNKYFEDFGCFDIEVTSSLSFKYGINFYIARMYDNVKYKYGVPVNKDDALNIRMPIMYIWQFQLGNTTILGRYWYEFIEFINLIKKQINDEYVFIVYAHNLNYEGSFLKYVLDVANENIFKKAESTILSMNSGCTEFRCSAQLSGKNLDEFTKNVKHHKAVDVNYDYEKVRFPWTPLTDDEIKYCVYDVLGLREAIQELFKIRKVNTQDVPLTQTGFVRRILKEQYKKNPEKVNQPNLDCYLYMKNASHGGNTCPSQNWLSDLENDDIKIIEDVYSYDGSKYYPSILIQEEFPVGPWTYIEKCTLEDLIRLSHNHYAWVTKATFKNIRLKDPKEPIPYIFKSKSTDRDNCKWFLDRRLLSAKYITLTITDVDFDIINNMYDFDNIAIDDCWYSKYGKLPKYIHDTIEQLYLEVAKYHRGEPEYDAAKTSLNAVHGLFGSDRLHDKYIVDEDEKLVLTSNRVKEYNKAVHKDPYSYAWYVWGTAIARLRLQELINANRENIVYVAVDSIKTIGKPNVTAHNERCLKRVDILSDEDRATNTCIGQFREEWHAKEFIAIGQNKYAFTTFEPKELTESELAFAEEINSNLKNPRDIKGFNVEVSMSGYNKSKSSIELYLRGGLQAISKAFTFRYAPRLESYKVSGEYKIKKDLTTSNTSISDEDREQIKKGLEICGGTVLINSRDIGKSICNQKEFTDEELRAAVDQVYKDFKNIR